MPKRKKAVLRWTVWLLLASSLVSAATYRTLASPARLRARVLAALRTFYPGQIELGQIALLPGRGLELTDLIVFPPPGRPLVGYPPQPLLHIASARVDCGWLGLLTGWLRPRAIEIHHLSANAVFDRADQPTAESSGGPDFLPQLLEPLLAGGPNWPSLTVASGDLQVMVIERDRPVLLSRLLWRGQGRPTQSDYRLRIDRRPAADQPLLTAQWKPDSGELEVTLDWVDLRTLTRIVSKQAARLFSELALVGRVRLGRMVLSAKPVWRSGPGERPLTDPSIGVQPGLAALWSGVRLAELHVTDGRCVLPVEEQSAGWATTRTERWEKHYLLLADLDAAIRYSRDDAAGGQVSLAGHARLRGSPASFSLRVRAEPFIREWIAGHSRRPDDRGAIGPGMEDVLDADLSVDGLELPTEQSYPAFVGSGHLPGALAAVFRDYQPRGRANLRLRILPGRAGADEAGSAAERFQAQIQLLGAHCRYRCFPYDFDDIHGSVRLGDGWVWLDGLTGRHGGGQVWAEGVVKGTSHWTGLDLAFCGQNVPLDEELYAALPEDYRKLWQRVAPAGLCDVTVAVRRPEGSAQTGPAPPTIDVQAHLLAGSLGSPDGHRLDHVHGWLAVHDGTVELKNLRGSYAGAEVRLEGRIPASGEETDSGLDVMISDLPIDRQVEIGSASGSPGVRLAFAGHADVWGRLAGELSSGRQSMLVRLKDGRLAGRDPGRSWTVEDGWLRLRGPICEIESITARQGQARLEIRGRLPSATGSDTPLSLEVNAQTPAIEDLYCQFTPEDWARLIDELGLAGTGRVWLVLHPNANDPMRLGQAADIEFAAERMKARAMPLELRDLQAGLSLAPGRFQLRQATAKLAPAGQLAVRQEQPGNWQGRRIDAAFQLQARGLEFGPELSATLPEPARRLLERLGLRGGLELDLPVLRVSGHDQPTWWLEGRLATHNAELNPGLKLTRADAELSGSCVIDADGLSRLDLKLNLARARVADRELEKWEGELLYERSGRWVRLERLQGRLCDGAARASLWIDPQSLDYELTLNMFDVSAGQMLPSPKDQPQATRRGRIDGELWLRGRGDQVSSRCGGGNLRIRGASFIQTPVLASVFQQRPKSSSSDMLDQAEVRFTWQGQQVRLERIDIRGRDLRLIGEGSWNLKDGTIRMLLWGGHPEQWPRLAMLNDLLTSTQQELMQYRVEGTLEAPRVTAEPLRRLNEALRRLLPPE